MDVVQVVPGLWQVKISFVHSFIFDSGEGLTLIDTGIPGSAPIIQNAVAHLGKRMSDVRRIIVTHCHSDHSGSVAELKRTTGAPLLMHRSDAEMVRAGKARRPLKPAPGLVNAFICRFLLPGAPSEIEPTEIEYEIQDGEILPGGLRAIHVPGHCAGQVALHWPEHGGVLIAADTAANVVGLALSPMYEDVSEGRRSLAKLSALKFEKACFGHGRIIQSAASTRFAKKWR
jgi:glyoxylase-like metal-dependent hydrolase (beta-lactamase superfamily II)